MFSFIINWWRIRKTLLVLHIPGLFTITQLSRPARYMVTSPGLSILRQYWGRPGNHCQCRLGTVHRSQLRPVLPSVKFLAGRLHGKNCGIFGRSSLVRVTHLALDTHYQQLLVAVSCESDGWECNDCRKQTGAWLKLSEVKRLAGTWGYLHSWHHFHFLFRSNSWT